MTFWRRLKLYLIGVGFGFIIIYFLFKDREIGTWTPESRIMTAIDSSSVSISQRALCQLRCYNLAEDDWKKVQANTELDLSESNAQKEPCPIYHLKGNWRESNYLLIWEVCESAEEVELLSIVKEGASCSCN